MIVISLGWGRQSFTLAAMAALGDLPAVDAAVFADTTFDRVGTYEFARTWTSWLEKMGVRVITTHVKSANPFNRFNGVHMPVFMIGPQGKGKLHRQCTREWKIRPIRRWAQATRQGKKVEMWIGISLDEFRRMKPSGVAYLENRWPLIELKMTREDCEAYLADHNLPIPPRSSCVFCPYHSNKDWAELKAQGGKDWKAAVTMDKVIRNLRPPYELYLHQSRIPLEKVDFPDPTALNDDVPGVRATFGDVETDPFEEECEGMCGV